MPPLWSVFDTYTQDWLLDQDAGLKIARYASRRLAEAAATKLNRTYERSFAE